MLSTRHFVAPVRPSSNGSYSPSQWRLLRACRYSSSPRFVLCYQRVGKQQELAHDSGDRSLRRPPWTKLCPCQFPDCRVTGAKPAKLAAALESSGPISGISASTATAVIAPIPGMDVSISKARACAESDLICFSISASRALSWRSMCRRRLAHWRLTSGRHACF